MFFNSPNRKKRLGSFDNWIEPLCVARPQEQVGEWEGQLARLWAKISSFYISQLFTFLFWSLTFPQELQSADLFVMITMIIIGCWLLTMMMKHKRKSLPQICCSIIESSGADGSEAIQCSLVHNALLLWCYSGATLVYQMGPKGWQRLSPPSPCTTLH